MLTLKDISLKSFIDEGLKSIRGLEYENAMLLLKNGITNCEELEKCIQSGDARFQIPIFSRIIHVAKVNLSKKRNSKSEPMTWHFDSYNKFPDLKERLIEEDASVSCDVLPVFSAADVRITELKTKLHDVSIKTAREQLGYITPELKNLFSTQFLNLTNKRLIEIATGISFYEEQVMRSVESDPNILDCEGPIFYRDMHEKQLMIEAIIEDIILYLPSLGEDFIWGKFSDFLSTRLLKSLSRTSDLRCQRIDNFISYLANYVTLQELEEGIIENGTLKRFVVQPKVPRI